MIIDFSVSIASSAKSLREVPGDMWVGMSFI